LAGLPGRKNLIWLSGGFPLFVSEDNPGHVGAQFGTFTAEMGRTIQALNDVGLAIYPVDARGLGSAFDLMPSMDIANRVALTLPSKNGGMATASPGGPAPAPVLNDGPRAMDERAKTDIIATEGTMNEIADRTGGRAFLHSNDIGGSIQRAIDDARVSYEISYTPSHDEWNGRFREIKVKVNRPGVDVRYRKGYFATPNENPRARPGLLVNAALSPLQSTGLTIVAKLTVAPNAETHHARVRLLLDPHQVSFSENAEGAWEANLDMLAIVGSAPGEILSQNSRAFHLILKGPVYAEALKNGVMITADMDAPEKATRSRIVVRDAETGAIGSIDISLI
jgi:hypothetical protein